MTQSQHWPAETLTHITISIVFLHLLEQYCEEWALTVNLDKTRVHGVPEEGQVSGKQIPVQLRRRSSGAQHQLLLPGHPDLCIGGLQSGCEGLV